MQTSRPGAKSHMRIIDNLDEMTETARGWLAGGTVGFVPLNGSFHAGHLTLVQAARQDCQVTVVSIVDDPAPLVSAGTTRNLSQVLRQLGNEDVDVVFAPLLEDLYPPQFSTYVTPSGPLVERLEGAINPGYLRGVATITTKLFQLVRPDIAYFGHKHAQEIAVIHHLVRDLNIDLRLRILPIVRESDGLAISSRNHLLSSKERRAARVIYRALLLAKALLENGERLPSVIEKAMARLVTKESLINLEYAAVCHPDTFEELSVIAPGTLFAIAVRIGAIRLVDNILWMNDGNWLI
jgi:pantoate--beta-alanine ligase